MAKDGSKSCQIIIPQNQVHRKSGIFRNPFYYYEPVYITLQEVENHSFIPKPHHNNKLFSIHIVPEEF